MLGQPPFEDVKHRAAPVLVARVPIPTQRSAPSLSPRDQRLAPGRRGVSRGAAIGGGWLVLSGPAGEVVGARRVVSGQRQAQKRSLRPAPAAKVVARRVNVGE